MRRRRRGVVVGAVALLATVLLGGASLAQDDALPWVIERYDVLVDVRPEGTLEIAEEITVDFRDSRRGIFREIPVRYDLAYDSQLELPDPELTPADYVRVYEIDDVSVSSPSAPDDVAITDDGASSGWYVIRIGEEDTSITGRHTYVIRYRVRGSLNDVGGATELYWNAIGTGWDAPIGAATVTVTGPVIQRVTCFQGPQGSDRLCDDVRGTGNRATFVAESLPPYAGLTAVVAFDPAAVQAPPPLLEERFDLGRRLLGSEAAIPLAILVALLVFGGVGTLAFREGRDRETIGGVGIDGTVRGQTRRRPLFSRPTVPVQFRPPDGLRPGQLGVIVDERVDPVDVTATIVDLAVRGWLRIVEDVSKRFLWITQTEHRLQRLDPPEGDELNRYERKLYDALFEDGDEVTLEDLKGEFHTEYVKVGKLMYEDARSRRWFVRSPETTRGRWVALGFMALLVSGLVTFLLLRFNTRIGIVGLPLLLGSLALIALNGVMPHRTAKGSELLVKTLGFKEFIVTAESGRMEFAEREHLFLDYLPYAVVFGATEKWAQAFEGLDIEEATRGVYVSTTGFHSMDGLSRSLTTFSSSAGSGLATSPSSSGSSGFGGGSSGGGGGGGGGGSW